MKRLLLSLIAITTAGFAFSQCSELFFSEYVEGGNNNKALEIYNPTASDINLSSYQIVRWSNGATNSDQDIRYVQPLTGNVPAYGTYVAVLDRRDPQGTGVDTILDPALLAYGNNNNADFYSPDYNSGTSGARVLTFNGDDAISLEKFNGATYDIVDLFGLVGERPQTSLGGTGAGWTDTPDYWNGIGAYWSKDQTLYRKQTIQGGVTTNPGIPYNSPGGFNPTLQWDSLPYNTFTHLGCHKCDCDPNVATVSCATGTFGLTASSVSTNCNGGCDGTATAVETNATAPVTYVWSDGASQTTATAIGLCAGTYTVTVTDAASLTATTTVTIDEPTLVGGSVTATNETFPGGNDGTAAATAAGGAGGYSYLWSDGNAQTGATAMGLAAGAYSVTVTDMNGCTYVASTIVNAATCNLTATFASVDESVAGAGDGSASVAPVGGTAPYTYLWDDPATQITDTATGLGAGNYQITLMDASGCGVIGQVTIGSTVGINSPAGNLGFKLYPNPLNGNTFFLQSQKPIKGITVHSLTGQMVYEELLRTEMGTIKVDLKNSSPGIYLVRVHFEGGQIETQKLIIK